MKILVIGGGAREHALVWKLSQSPGIGEIFCAPGNGGIAELATCVNTDLSDFTGLIRFCSREGIGFVVVGPENTLAGGIVDAFEESGIPIFGPRQAGAALETSKIFSKELMAKYGVPTAGFRVFDDHKKASEYIKDLSLPYVIKADGLCAGKGAYVIQHGREGAEVVRKLLVEGVFGEAGRRIIVEDYLRGIEASYLAFADGEIILPMLPSQDHKPLLDGDRGPNTGGMGAYTPVPFISPDLEERIKTDVMARTVGAMRSEGISYRGILYGGLMIGDGTPYTLEFNARFGDPETQPLLFHMETDLLPILAACVEGRLTQVPQIQWKKGVSICVVLASKGYPDSPEKGKVIEGLEGLKSDPRVMVFHAGTRREGNRILTAGGRVLGVTARGDTYEEAIRIVYEAVSCIQFEGMQYRADIGKKALNR